MTNDTTPSPVSFSYKKTKIGLVIGVIVALTALIMSVLIGMNSPKIIDGSYNSKEYVASLSDLANGCGNTFLFSPKPNQYGIIPDSFYEKPDDIPEGTKLNVPAHKMLVPVYGYMEKVGLTESDIRFWTEKESTEPINKEQLFNNMFFDDTIVIWYSQDIRPGDLSEIQAYVKENDNIIVRPWEYSGGILPGKRKIAYSAWGMSKSCQFYSEESLEDFIQFTKDNKVSREPAPEIIELETNGSLPKIKE